MPACLLPLFSIPVSVANRLEKVQLDLRMEEEKKFNQFTRRLFVHLLSNFNQELLGKWLWRLIQEDGDL